MRKITHTSIEIVMDVKEANEFLGRLMSNLGIAQTNNEGKVRLVIIDDYITVASGYDDGHGKMMWTQ